MDLPVSCFEDRFGLMCEFQAYSMRRELSETFVPEILGRGGALQVLTPSFSFIPLIGMLLLFGGNAFSQPPSPAASPTTTQDLREMRFGEKVTRAGAANEVHGYQIALEAGTSVRLDVGNRDIAIIVSAMVPGKEDYEVPGKKIPSGEDFALINSSSQGVVEPLVIVADMTSSYLIKVRFRAKGTYSLTCNWPHASTEQDRKYAYANRLFLESRNSTATNRLSAETIRLKHEERVDIYRGIDDKVGLALSLTNLAQTEDDPIRRLEYRRESIALFRSLGSVPDLLDYLRGLVADLNDAGHYQEAIETRREILAISRSTGNKVREVGVLNGLGASYGNLGDQQTARYYNNECVRVQRSITPPELDSLLVAGLCLSNTASGYGGIDWHEIRDLSEDERKDQQKALEYYYQGLQMYEEAEKLSPANIGSKANNLMRIGNTHKLLGNYPAAHVYLNRALGLNKDGKRVPPTIEVLNHISSLHVWERNYQQAFESLDQALTLSRANGNYGLVPIARQFYFAGQSQKALDLLYEALGPRGASPQRVGTADILYEIARAENDLGRLDIARSNIEEAIQIVESLRGRITDLEIRTSYSSTIKRYFDLYITLLMRLHRSRPGDGFDKLALQTSDKARSRSLLDMLTLSGVNIKQGVDPLLLARETAVGQKLAAKAARQSRILLTNPTTAEVEKIKQEVSELTNEYNGILTEIRVKSPGYAGLTQPSALNTKQIQELLDSGTILLEYSLGEKKSYLWGVSSDSIASFDLPKKSDIEAEVRKVYELATARNLQIKGEPVETRAARIRNADAEYAIAAASLSEALLGPAAQLIRNKRLLIVPDGALSYISFAALPEPKLAENVSPIGAVLGLDHEVVSLPSASVLGRLRHDSVARKAAPKLLAVFADPVFSQTDTRAKLNAGVRTKKTEPTGFALARDFERALVDSGLGTENSGGLPRLPFSRREANSIFDASAKNVSLKHLDFAASKRSVFDSGLDQFRILHFATHSLADSQNPGLSGIVLSLVDKQGADVDGFLRLQDIYNLRLNADLVVLSACSTALGKEVKGEGLIGLTRGFMYAGSPRVVASLWKVDDQETATFMTIFHRKMRTDNLRPAAALRAAQTEMMKQPRWRSPYYWAPFVLQGEWK